MQEWLVTALLWLGFGGTHVVLTMHPVRARLVRILGEMGFVLVYSAVALITFSALVHYVALHRFAAPYAPLVATIPPVRGALLFLAMLGFSLFVAGVFVYPQLPMAEFGHRVTPVRGIQQITRHPFFSGIAIWAAAHALLSPSRVTFVFFVGVIVLGFVGGMHQDRRLVAELGESYRSYVAATSFWPLVAVATKRQKIRWTEQPWLAYGLGVLTSFGLYQAHDHIFDYGGLYVIAVTATGSVVALVSSKVRSARRVKA